MKFHPILGLVFSLFLTLLFAPNAFAQAGQGGIDIRLGLGAHALTADVNMSVSGDSSSYLDSGASSDNWLAGPVGQISIGYRWQNFGIYLDQDLSGLWSTEGGEGQGAFMGGTFVTVRGILPVRDRLQIDLGIGLGALYGAETDEMPSIVANRKGEPSAMFGLKGSFYLTYYINRAFGIGLHLDYIFGVNKFSDEEEILGITMKAEMTLYYHNLLPGLHAVIRF